MENLENEIINSFKVEQNPEDIDLTCVITLDIPQLYNISSEETKNIFEKYFEFKTNLEKNIRNKIFKKEIQLKSKIENDSFEDNSWLISGNKELEELSSIFKFINFQYKFKGVPVCLFKEKIENITENYWNNHQIILDENQYKVKKDEKKNLIIIDSNISDTKLISILRNKLFFCANDKCFFKSQYIEIFDLKGRSTIYFHFKKLYYLVLEFNKKCRGCKNKLEEKIERRNYLHFFEFFVFDTSKYFRAKSFYFNTSQRESFSSLNSEESQFVLGFVDRDFLGNLNFNVINIYKNYEKEKNDLRKNKSPKSINPIFKNNSVLKYFDESKFLNVLQGYSAFFLKDLKEKVFKNDIGLVIILHIFLVDKFSTIALITNDVIFLQRIAANFFNSFNLNIEIKTAVDSKNLPKNFFTSKNILLIIENEELRKFKIQNLVDKFKYKFEINRSSILNIQYDISDTKFEFRKIFDPPKLESIINLLNDIAKDLFVVSGCSSRVIDTICSLLFVLQNVLGLDYCDSILLLVIKELFEGLVR